MFSSLMANVRNKCYKFCCNTTHAEGEYGRCGKPYDSASCKNRKDFLARILNFHLGAPIACIGAQNNDRKHGIVVA